MKFRRRKYFINRSYQSKVILLFVIVAFVGACTTIAAFNYLALKEIDSRMWSVHIDATSTGDFLGPLFVKINIFSFIFISVLLIICAVWIIRKTSGPLYRISADIDKVTSGDLTAEIILREGDDFTELAHDLNEMIRSIRSNFAEIYSKCRSVSEKIAALKTRPFSRDELINLINEIEQIETHIKKIRTD